MDNPVAAIENATVIDTYADPVAEAASKLFPAGPIKDGVSGTWLGHPVHPLLTDVPIGLWVSSVAVDVLGGRHGGKAAQLLASLGVAAAVPTAVTGLSDWVDCYGEERRVGAVHAISNVAATALFAMAVAARSRRRRGRAFLLSLVGLGAVCAGGYLGGHLSYRLGVGVDRTRFDEKPEEWTDVADAAECEEGKAKQVYVKGASIMLVRRGDRIHAVADKCSHRGGPLNEGDIDAERCTVTCPWHASEFDFTTGEIVRGPATAPQPVYQTRVEKGRVQVSWPHS